MVNVIGVRFKDNGKIYYFSAGDLPVEVGSRVIVETARGVEYGKVVLGNRQVEEKKIISNLKPVIRIATEEDKKINEANQEKSKEAFKICQEKIAKHGLKMKLMDCEYTFDNNKVLFYFTADGRIDFRDLVKDLASVFKTRIELRQIGVRDETKIMGGIGICGRPLCCHTFLSEFSPVSIKMAKEQNLSLNPSKISGACGRLMCCLKNEQETYEYLNSKMPRNGDEVVTPSGEKGVVHAINVLRQRVKVVITKENDDREIEEYSVDELTLHKGNRKKGGKNYPNNNKENHQSKDQNQASVKAADIDNPEALEEEKMEDNVTEAVKSSESDRPEKADKPKRERKSADRQEGSNEERKNKRHRSHRPHHKNDREDTKGEKKSEGERSSKEGADFHERRRRSGRRPNPNRGQDENRPWKRERRKKEKDDQGQKTER